MKVLKTEVLQKKGSQAQLIIHLCESKTGRQELHFQIRGAKDMAERAEMINHVAHLREQLADKLELSAIDIRSSNYELEAKGDETA